MKIFEIRCWQSAFYLPLRGKSFIINGIGIVAGAYSKGNAKNLNSLWAASMPGAQMYNIEARIKVGECVCSFNNSG